MNIVIRHRGCVQLSTYYILQKSVAVGRKNARFIWHRKRSSAPSTIGSIHLERKIIIILGHKFISFAFFLSDGISLNTRRIRRLVPHTLYRVQIVLHFLWISTFPSFKGPITYFDPHLKDKSAFKIKICNIFFAWFYVGPSSQKKNETFFLFYFTYCPSYLYDELSTRCSRKSLPFPKRIHQDSIACCSSYSSSSCQKKSQESNDL